MRRILNTIKTLAIVSLLFSLTACKSTEVEQVLEQKQAVTILKLSPNAPYDTFHKRLRRALNKHDIQVGDYRQTTIPTLHIVQEDISTEALEYDVNDKLRLEDINYELEFKVTDKFGNILIPATKLLASKEHKVNPDSEISILNERDMITYELQQEVITQMLKLIAEIDLSQ